MSWVLFAYWVCFLVGLGYAIVAAVLSGLFGFGHGAEGGVEVGGHDVGAGGFDHDFSADGAAGHGEGFATGESGTEVALSPWSPMTMAVFITCFGGVGVILTNLHWPIWLSLPPAVGSGVIVAGLVFLFLVKVFMAVQGSSEPTVATLVGGEAEVITSIPAEGLGEIAYVARGSRFTAPARSETGAPIARHSVVRIVKIVGATFQVRKVAEEELRALSAEEASQPAPPPAGGEQGSGSR
jgi:membrane protein implicated in regulation of membrane protease activity